MHTLLNTHKDGDCDDDGADDDGGDDDMMMVMVVVEVMMMVIRSVVKGWGKQSEPLHAAGGNEECHNQPGRWCSRFPGG